MKEETTDIVHQDGSSLRDEAVRFSDDFHPFRA
jgi:hypothetical protein